MLNELNATFETVTLVAGCHQPEELSKEKYWEQLAEYGIKNDKRLEEVYDLTVAYHKAFAEHAVIEPADLFFFKGKNQNVALLFLMLLLDHENWLTQIEEVSESDIYEALIAECFDPDRIPNTLSDVIEIFKEAEDEQEETDPEFNWRFLLVLENPKEYMSKFVQMINQNIPAFHHAAEKMKQHIEPLLAEFETNCDLFLHHELENLSSFLLEQKLLIIPSFASPVMFAAVEDGAAVGLCYHEIYGYLDRRNQPVEKIIPVLKVLGDSSKFEILRFLKEAPNYNVEIAKHMGLTPATVSHHMNVLFTLNLVTMEQVNKKVYYSINEEQVQKIISNLEIAFL